MTPPTTPVGTPVGTPASASDAAASEQPPVEQLVRQLYGLAAVRRGLAQAATKELASGGFSALVAIHRRDAARVSEIAHALQIDLSVASRQIAALVEAGYVSRASDPADGRAHVLQLTAAGRTVLSDAHHRMIDVLEGALTGWPADKILTLADGLAELIERFTAGPAGPAPATTTEVSA